jgi:hypothetical protein
MSIDLGVPGCWITEKEERNERNTFGSNTHNNSRTTWQEKAFIDNLTLMIRSFFAL